MVPVVVLAAVVLGVLFHPRRLPVSTAPVVGAVALAATRHIGGDDVSAVWSSMWGSLGFLILAVPVAVLLDRAGFFAAAAALVDGGRHLVLGLWVLGALVTTVLNLDASVVLLTPLYVRIANRRGIDPLLLAVQPVLLASFASSALPVSNLTNLIAAESLDLSSAQFLRHLALPSLVACTVGYVAYRVWSGPVVASTPLDEPADRAALLRGLPVAGFLLAGFVAGEHIGLRPVHVTAIAFAWLVVTASPERRRGLPLPWDAALLAFGLALVASAAAPELRLERFLADGDSAGAVLTNVGLGVVGANAINNLPALLVLLPGLGSTAARWGVLLGVNLGPSLVITGSLAGLLWRDTASRLGVDMTMAGYSRMGLRIGLPALLAAAGSLALVI